MCGSGTVAFHPHSTPPPTRVRGEKSMWPSPTMVKNTGREALTAGAREEAGLGKWTLPGLAGRGLCVGGEGSLRASSPQVQAEKGSSPMETLLLARKDSRTSKVHTSWLSRLRHCPYLRGGLLTLSLGSIDLRPLDAEITVVDSFIQKHLPSTYCGQSYSRHCPCSLYWGRVRQ